MTNILDLATPAVESVESINVLLHGDSGAGKTVFAGSGREEGKNDLILAIEQGTLSAARRGSKANVLPIKTWEELDAAVTAICDDPERFDWVIVDSLTKMQDLIWSHILDEAVGRNPSRSPFKKELQEYGEAQQRLSSIIERLNSSDANIIYTALSELHVDEEANEFKMPSIHGQSGKLAAWVCAQMDVVAYISVARNKDRKEFRKFQFNKTPEVFAKDRLNIFPKPVANLTLEKFTDKLLEESDDNDKAEEKPND